MVAAPGHIHPLLAAVAVLCIAVGAGASGAINMWYDRDIDAIMSRTRGRPIPMGRIEPSEAAGFGVVLAIGSVGLMALAVNLLAAGLLAVTILFYVFVYTIWLKRRTPQNIVIGGAAGAFPPMIGWAAVTGHVSLAPIMLFLLIFMWTPPHFWALALFRTGDYAKAGVPMLPVVAGARATKLQMLIYTLVLFPHRAGALGAGHRGQSLRHRGGDPGRVLHPGGGQRLPRQDRPQRQAHVRLLDPLSLPALRADHRRPGAGADGRPGAVAGLFS